MRRRSARLRSASTRRPCRRRCSSWAQPWSSGLGGTNFLSRSSRPVNEVGESTPQEVAMRAVTVSEYGGQPRVSDVPKPKAGPGQVLIKVLAAGMNPMDRAIAMGAWKERMPAKFPLVLGADVAGVIEEVGTDESRFHRGDKVFGQLLVPPLGSTGTYADYVAVAAEAPLAKIPASLDPTVAAALPPPRLPAYQLAQLVGVVRDKTVLVVGAAGALGAFLTQLLTQAGARVISVVPGSEADRVREHGALDTIDYTSQRVVDTVRRMRPNRIDPVYHHAYKPEE